MRPIHSRPRHVIGLQVRTKNSDETNPSTARIGPLWGRVFQEDITARIPHRVPGRPLLAVYTDYESDHHGEYSLILGPEVVGDEAVPPGMVAATIQPGDYIVFPVSEPSPAAIQAAWREVWSAFDDPGGPRRAYTTDFEEYRLVDGQLASVAIAVAVNK